MSSSRPSRHRPPHSRPRRHADEGGLYRTRFLLSLAASLCVLLVAVHLPLPDTPLAIGWGPTEMERLTVTDLGDQEPEPEPKAELADSAPTPTQHEAPPETAPPVQISETLEAHSDGETDAPSSDESRAVPMALLKMQGAPPEIMGGMKALYFNIDYPKAAREQGIQGRLILSYVVDTDGRARDIRVVRSLHPLCDEAAMRALRSVRFQPGMQNGQKVPVAMSLPVRFRLVEGDVNRPATTTVKTSDATIQDS